MDPYSVPLVTAMQLELWPTDFYAPSSIIQTVFTDLLVHLSRLQCSSLGYCSKNTAFVVSGLWWQTRQDRVEEENGESTAERPGKMHKVKFFSTEANTQHHFCK